MTIANLADLNAVLNVISTCLLSFGYYHIRRGHQEIHKRFMLAALTSSILFLISYVTYHYSVGSVPYPYYDWTRPIYFTVLIPHVILAVLMTPFIIILVIHALRGRFDRHRKLARFIWPIWMFVSVSGVVVYLMLYG